MSKKPVPTTTEEIEWFLNFITEGLNEVQTKPQLAQLWTTHATSIAALPAPLKAQVIALKDSIKARFV